VCVCVCVCVSGHAERPCHMQGLGFSLGFSLVFQERPCNLFKFWVEGLWFTFWGLGSGVEGAAKH
jgi:hypothetical protein